VLAMLSASLAVADDFKTSNGKEYKNATVTRVEPDGIVIKFSGGIVKLPFTDLPEEMRTFADRAVGDVARASALSC
jgi:hypothetical protein